MTHFFHPEIFLDIAKQIKDCRDLNEEGKHRVSIGRAYWAAFLTTREYLKRFKGWTFGEKKQHKEVLDALDILNEEFIKNELEKLAKNRVNADYYLNISIEKELCENCLTISEDIINSIEGI